MRRGEARPSRRASFFGCYRKNFAGRQISVWVLSCKRIATSSA
ncbi:unnamed protein product [Brucella canis str. Oliveri]|nr:unnamed protein product [Brucella canis str. Oliveri]